MPMLGDADVVYARESLTDTLWGEIQPLLADHWEEVACYKDIPLCPDGKAYERVCDADRYRIFTARINGALCGYLGMFVTPSMHYMPRIMAIADVFYVQPEQRGTHIGADLVRFAHKRLKEQDNV